jgi:hydroxymethylpyrimidine/phosphomethylpyrimidine kinase
VTADLMVFAAHGLFGTACITALTVQSTLGVRETHPVSDEIVAATLSCLGEDLPPAGIKIGMLSSLSNIFGICSYLQLLQQQHSGLEDTVRVPIVVDPVLRSSSGRELLNPAGVAALRDRLLPLIDWLTPNLDELAVLIGEPVRGREDVPRACKALQERVGQANGRRLGILATGGHMDPPDDFLLLPTGEERWLPGKRVATRSTHGTGCALSSAFLSRLVLGDEPIEAAVAAKEYVVGALQQAAGIGSGNGPMNHLWPLLRVAD